MKKFNREREGAKGESVMGRHESLKVSILKESLNPGRNCDEIYSIV